MTSKLCRTVQELTTLRDTMFITETHESFEFQIRNVPGFHLLDGQDCWGAFACVIKTQKFFFDDFDASRRLPTDID